MLAGGEPVLAEEPRSPLLFTWTILEEVESLSHVERETSSSSARAIVLTAKKHLIKNIPHHRITMLRALERKGVVTLDLLPDDLWVGGRLRERQAELASAMICIGGGKGVSDLACRMQDRRAPVLPLDLDIGSIANDGEGSLGLYRGLLADPQRFFPHTFDSIRRQLFGLSLQEQSANVQRVAALAVHMICQELSEAGKTGPADIIFVTALTVELDALRMTLGAKGRDPLRTRSGTHIWRTTINSQASGDLRVVLCCVGAAGNVASSSFVSELLLELHPRLVIMVGIAAGMPGKRRLGEVVIADEVVAYEPAALVEDKGRHHLQARPRTYYPSHMVHQDVLAYVSTPEEVAARVTQGLRNRNIEYPAPNESAVAGPCVSLATVASGEKLIRDSVVWDELRRIHGKIDVTDMEAVGIAQACQQHTVPFLVIRGISDFGDKEKNDRYHGIASAAASEFAVDFIREGYHLPGRNSPDPSFAE